MTFFRVFISNGLYHWADPRHPKSKTPELAEEPIHLRFYVYYHKNTRYSSFHFHFTATGALTSRTNFRDLVPSPRLTVLCKHHTWYVGGHFENFTGIANKENSRKSYCPQKFPAIWYIPLMFDIKTCSWLTPFDKLFFDNNSTKKNSWTKNKHTHKHTNNRKAKQFKQTTIANFSFEVSPQIHSDFHISHQKILISRHAFDGYHQ